MKKFVSFILAFVCVLGLVGCHNQEIYNFNGVHESFTISDCTLHMVDNNEKFTGGTLKITQPEVFENIVSCTMRYYLLFEDGYSYPIRTLNIDDLSNGYDLNGKSLGNGGSIGSTATTHLFKNPDAKLWFELITKDVNNVENVYKIQMTLVD